MFDKFATFVRELYQTSSFIPLHEPSFRGNEKKFLIDVVDSTFVSSVGESVTEFENKISDFTGIKYAVAIVNCTSALHLALLLAKVEKDTEVLTQSLNFIAGCNAINYCNAKPVFIDVDQEKLSICPDSLDSFLNDHCEVRNDGHCWNKHTNNRVSACLPMNTYGFPSDTIRLKEICMKFNIPLIEDSAESLGSFSLQKHTGSNSLLSTLSFNGNKIITTGGGGMILTESEDLYKKAKHLSTTAKLEHSWHFIHDQVGFNYRMPNLNAALGLAQLELLPDFIESKRSIAEEYQNWGRENGVIFLKDTKDSKSNYWLNCMMLSNLEERDKFLAYTNENNIMTRPTWKPMHQLDLYKNCLHYGLPNTESIHKRLVNVPSSPI